MKSCPTHRTAGGDERLPMVYMKATKGAGAKFGADPHSRDGKTNTSQHSNSKEVQSTPGERRNLVGGHSGSAVFVA